MEVSDGAWEVGRAMVCRGPVRSSLCQFLPPEAPCLPASRSIDQRSGR